jgi:hypothetical protein
MFIVTCVDYGETCDGHARLLNVFSNYSEAVAYVESDMGEHKGEYGEDEVFDGNRHEIWASKEEVGVKGCVWDIFNTEFI